MEHLDPVVSRNSALSQLAVAVPGLLLLGASLVFLLLDGRREEVPNEKFIAYILAIGAAVIIAGGLLQLALFVSRVQSIVSNGDTLEITTALGGHFSVRLAECRKWFASSVLSWQQPRYQRCVLYRAGGHFFAVGDSMSPPINSAAGRTETATR